MTGLECSRDHVGETSIGVVARTGLDAGVLTSEATRRSNSPASLVKRSAQSRPDATELQDRDSSLEPTREKERHVQ
jgi:hypothetical protein